MTIITVNDKMQQNYQYELTEEVGDLPDNFNPTATPQTMLQMGVFGGKYLNDCQQEFPVEWYTDAKMNTERYEVALNYFRVRASQSLAMWRKNGWIDSRDPRGWFQWYCRFYMGRRIEGYDDWQITRWRNIKRHLTYILNRYDVMEWSKHHGSPKKRQALLHWGVRVDGTISADDLRESFL